MTVKTEHKAADKAEKWHSDDKLEPEVKPVEPPKEPEVKKAKVATVSGLNKVDEKGFAYPLHDIKHGDGFFVANEPNETTAQTMARVGREVAIANKAYAVVETDENGDEVWENVYVRTTKLNADGTLQLDGTGRIIYGHDPVSRPNYLYTRRYAICRIAKGDMIGDKASEADGVLVTRVL